MTIATKCCQVLFLTFKWVLPIGFVVAVGLYDYLLRLEFDNLYEYCDPTQANTIVANGAFLSGIALGVLVLFLIAQCLLENYTNDKSVTTHQGTDNTYDKNVLDNVEQGNGVGLSGTHNPQNPARTYSDGSSRSSEYCYFNTPLVIIVSISLLTIIVVCAFCLWISSIIVIDRFSGLDACRSGMKFYGNQGDMIIEINETVCLIYVIVTSILAGGLLLRKCISTC